MQSIRAIIAQITIIILLLTATYATVSRAGGTLRVEPLGPVGNLTVVEGPGCTYLLVLELDRPANGTITILRNGVADVTGLAIVKNEGTTVRIDTRGVPALELGPGDYHLILLNGEPLVNVSCMPTADVTPGTTSGNSGSTTTHSGGEAVSPRAGLKTVPPPDRDVGAGAPGYKGFFHLVVSAAAGVAAVLSAVREHARNRESDTSA